jgi:tetratricopeptide (TPR) repeat protein
MVDVDKVLDAALKQVMEDPPKLAETEADFREIIATGYLGLSQYAKSIELQRRVVQLRQQLGETNDAGYADTLHQYAATLWWNGQYDEAAPIYEQSLALRRKLLGNDHADVALSLTHLAACRIKQDRVEEASKLYGQALDMRRKLLGASHQDVAASLNNLAKSEAAAGRYERAESHFREALAMVQRLNGNDDLTTATAQNNLALFLIDSGRAADAIDLIASALATRQAKLSPTHHFVILSRLALARARFAVSASREAREQAAAEASTALQSLEKLLSLDHPDVIDASGQVGLMLAGSGSREAGLKLLERAASSQRQSRQATQRDRDESALRLALGRAQRVDDAEAAKALASVLASIDPNKIGNSLRLACVERMRQAADAAAFESLLPAWGKAALEPREAQGP